LTFDKLCASEFTATLAGDEMVGLYIALAREEERLDPHQRVALERLRAILYEHLSVEQLEDIGISYAERLAGEGSV